MEAVAREARRRTAAQRKAKGEDLTEDEGELISTSLTGRAADGQSAFRTKRVWGSRIESYHKLTVRTRGRDQSLATAECSDQRSGAELARPRRPRRAVHVRPLLLNHPDTKCSHLEPCLPSPNLAPLHITSPSSFSYRKSSSCRYRSPRAGSAISPDQPGSCTCTPAVRSSSSSSSPFSFCSKRPAGVHTTSRAGVYHS